MTAADIDLRMAQREAETELTDKCLITREGEEAFNEDTGLFERTTVTVYDGKCALRNSGGARETLLAGREVDIFEYTLKLPFRKSAGVSSDDLVTITASKNAPEHVGRQVRVKAHRTVTHATLRRLPVEEVTPA